MSERSRFDDGIPELAPRNHEGLHHEGLHHEGLHHEGLRVHEGHEGLHHEGLRVHEGHEVVHHGGRDGLQSPQEDRGASGDFPMPDNDSPPERIVNFQMRHGTSLGPRAEETMRRVIGCAVAVHRALGPGFLESIYRRAMWIELAAQNLPFESERSIRVVYRGVEIPGQRVDLIVGGEIASS